MAKRTSSETAAPKSRVPEMATNKGGASHPYIDPSPAFIWIFNPERFAIIAGRLVPGLQKQPLVGGVNRIEIDKDQRVHFAQARARLEEQGRTVVPYEWAPDGESYLQCLETRPDGKSGVADAWISVFESADVGARETTPDEEAYSTWLAELVTSKKLPACRPNVAKRMLERTKEKLASAQAEAAKLGGHGRASLRAQALARETEVLESYCANLKAEKAASVKRSVQVQG